MLNEVASYYSSKLIEHGETPRGVDWNGKEGQIQRFEQLTRILPKAEPFALNDLGCGYGALVDHLNSRHQNFSYYGYDVSGDMIDVARNRFANAPNVQFAVAAEPASTVDFGIASGIFNVKLEATDADWRKHMETTIEGMDRTSRYGFAFNCLTSYSDENKMRKYLYYADPCYFFDLCKRRYSRHVALLHDYGLYEFTILVRKNI